VACAGAGAPQGLLRPADSHPWSDALVLRAGRHRFLPANSADRGAERLLLLADSAGGISAVANPQDLLFVTLELTVHLRQDPAQGWLSMSEETRADPNGSGIASGGIGDAAGDLARTEQLSFVQPITR
jgi:hypothetical protein